MFTTMVTRNSASPISISALRYVSSEASANSFAITLAIVDAGASYEILHLEMGTTTLDQSHVRIRVSAADEARSNDVDVAP